MKHKHKDYVKFLEQYIEALTDKDTGEVFLKSLLANEATLERHEESDGGAWGGEGKKYCLDCSEDFPCPTYTDVTNQLDKVM